jgi:hypothetical protein
MERAFIEEAVSAELPPEPVAEAPVAPLDATLEELALEETASLHVAPPPEIDDVASGVLPARLERLLADEDDVARSFDDIQAPFKKVEPLELPSTVLTEEDEAMLLARLGEERFLELERQIDRAYDDVRSIVGENEAIATECYNQLLLARDIALRREPGRMAQAEYYVEQVRTRLQRAADSETAAEKYQWRILAWGLFWCGLFLAAQILVNQPWLSERLSPSNEGASPFVNMEIFLSSMLWGGIGGVVAVLYSLFRHIGNRDFDTQYNISYIGKPFLGLVLGASVYMAYQLVVRAMGIFPVDLAGEEGGTPVVVAPGLMYLMAWAGGFKEDRIFELVDQMLKRVISGEGAT